MRKALILGGLVVASLPFVSEGVVHLTPVRDALCERAIVELESRFDEASMKCTSVSVWHRAVELRDVDVMRKPLRLHASQAVVTWPLTATLEGVILNAGPLRVAPMRAVVVGRHVRFDGAPDLCVGSRCTAAYEITGELEPAGRWTMNLVVPEAPWTGDVTASGHLDERLAHVAIADLATATVALNAGGVSAAVNVQSYAALLEALAPQTPALLELGIDGPLTARLSGDRLDLNLTRLYTADAARTLDYPFAMVPLAADNPPELMLDPDDERFVALGSLPTHVVKAVLYAEDAGFMRHDGFDPTEIVPALREAGAGGRVRGASTITQQLAKNLWLSPERTLERKVREALGAVALEAALPKERILEIYLNTIEWGPGLFGLGDAATHYFGKTPQTLTPKEAAFLASIIPNPRRYHMYCERGELTPRWEKRVMALVGLLHARGDITEEELGDAAAVELVFAEGGAEGEIEAPVSRRGPP